MDIVENGKTSTSNPNVYYIYEPSTVIGVMGANTGDGYSRKNSIDELTPGSYYYNITSKTCIFTQQLV